MSDDLFLLPGSADAQVLRTAEARDLLEREVLPAYLPRCRWFGGKARGPRAFSIRELVAVSADPGSACLALVEVAYASGAADTYLLPLQVATAAHAEALTQAAPTAIIARFADGGVLFDAVHDAAFRAALFTLIARGGSVRSPGGEIVGIAGRGQPDGLPESRVLAVEQSNSSIIYGERIFLKLYRR